MSHGSYKIKNCGQRKLDVASEDVILSSDEEFLSSDDSDTDLEALENKNSSEIIHDYRSSDSSNNSSVIGRLDISKKKKKNRIVTSSEDSLSSPDSPSNNIFSGRLKKHNNIFISQKKRGANTFSDEESKSKKKRKTKLKTNSFFDLECGDTLGYNSNNSITSEEYFDNEFDTDDNFIDNSEYSSNLEMYYKLNNDYINSSQKQ